MKTISISINNLVKKLLNLIHQKFRISFDCHFIVSVTELAFQNSFPGIH